MAETRSVRFVFIGHDKSAGKTMKRLGGQADHIDGRFKRLGKSIGRSVAKAVRVGGAAAVAGAAVGVKTAAELEQARVGFETLLGSGEKAEKFLGDLKKFAKETPFELPGLVQTSRQLLGAGASAKSTIPTITAWGNASAALGLTQDQFGRVMTAVTQIMSKGKVQSEEMLQITEAGIPIWKILSKALGMPVPQIQKLMSSGDLLSKDVLPALEKQMQKDYGGAMAKQSQTLAGRWSNFMDSLKLGLAEVVQPLIPILKKGLGGAIKFLDAAFSRLPGILDTVGVFARDKVLPAIRQFGGYLREHLLPAAKSMAGAFRSSVLPLLRDFGVFLRDQVLPVLVRLGRFLIERVVPILIRFTAAVLRNKDLLIASAAAIGGYIVAVKGIALASRAASVATKAWAAAQAVLNLAMKMSTFGLVVAAIAALVAIVVLAWKRCESFRKVVTAAWNGIKVAAAVAWTILKKIFMGLFGYFRGLWQNAQRSGSFVGKAWNFIKAAASIAWKVIKAVISGYIKYLKFLWSIVIKAKNVIVAAWGLIRRAIGAAWAWIKQHVVDPWRRFFAVLWKVAIRLKSIAVNAWNTMRARLGAGWTWIRDKVFAPMRRGFQAVWDKAVQIKNGIVNAWNALRRGTVSAFNKLKSAIKKPINAVINWVNDKIISGLNRVTKPFNLEIKKIPRLNGGGEAKHGRGSTHGVRMSGGLTRNKGGEIPGVGIDRDKVLTNLTPGESVFTRTRTKELKAMGGVGAVDAINRKGWDSVFGGASKGRMLGTDAMGGFGDWLRDSAGKVWDTTKSIVSGVKDKLQSAAGKASWAVLSNTVFPLIDNGLKAVTRDKPTMAGEFPYGVFQKLKTHVKNWLLNEDAEEAAKLMGSLGLIGAGKYGGISLSGEQVKNALTIMNVAKAVGASTRDAVIGIMTAMQESNLRNIRYGDRDSLGLFQQRAAWGPASARLNPITAARMFFRGGRRGQPGLLDIKGRNKMSLAAAAQAVQRSAFPGAYAKWAGMAKALVKAAKSARAGGQVSAGRIMKPGTYRVGRGSRAHGYPSVDLPAPIGTRVYSPWAGTASRKSLRTSYGKHVFVKGFSNGLTFLAAHLSRHAGGRIVQRGQLIGYVGSTGNSTGPHLHAEVRRGRTRLEPRRYLKYDQGGILPPGRSLVRNNTGKPEFVFTDAQMRAMRPRTAAGGDHFTIEVNQQISDLADPQAAGRAVVAAVETYLTKGGTVGTRWKKASTGTR